MESQNKESVEFNCWDEDINELVHDLDAVSVKHELTHDVPTFSIWEHAPRSGYRLAYTIHVRRDSDIIDELQRIADKYEQRSIGVNIGAGALYFYRDTQTARLYIFSEFKDARKKVKNPEKYKAQHVSA